MKYKKGDILRGRENGRKIEIINCTGTHYIFKEVNGHEKFIADCKTFEKCAVDIINGSEK